MPKRKERVRTSKPNQRGTKVVVLKWHHPWLKQGVYYQLKDDFQIKKLRKAVVQIQTPNKRQYDVYICWLRKDRKSKKWKYGKLLTVRESDLRDLQGNKLNRSPITADPWNRKPKGRYE